MGYWDEEQGSMPRGPGFNFEEEYPVDTFK